MEGTARRLGAACLVALVALVGPLGAGATRAMGPLPACRYDSILTDPRRYEDWPITLVDTILRVPSTYAPQDLRPVSEAGLAGGGSIRAVTMVDLTAMTADAKAAGSPIAVASAYRSYVQQKATFQYWVDTLGYKRALQVSARPGHSEHQLGLAIDFKSEPGGAPWSGGDWALTPAGKWMHANAWKYGWVLSYPKDAFAKVCYTYEPWHYRYVGRALAADIHAANATIREYLWAHFTKTVVGPPKSPAPSGAAASPPAPPSLEPTLPPSPSASLPPTVAPTLEPSAEPPPATPQATAAPPPSPVGFLDGPAAAMLLAVGAGLAILVLAGLLLGGRFGRRAGR